MGRPVISIHNISCERDDRILFNQLSFNFNSGAIIQLEGPNGAGKTTLLRILAGLFTSFEGELRYGEQLMSECRLEFQQNLLFIGHKSAVKTSMTPLENLRYALGLKRFYEEDELWTALEKVGLAGYEHVLCRNLSAGQQRRVALARLYLSHEQVWILDEIFTAIDKRGVAQFEALLAEKAREGKTVILTTHHQFDIPELEILSLGGQVSYA